MIFFNPLEVDLNYILEHTLPLWDALRNQRIFITGGTGFYGQWLLESFCWINKKLTLNAKGVVLTRHTASFASKNPHIFHDPCLSFYEGNVLDFNYPKGSFHCIIHAAADGGVKFKKISDFLMLETIVQGTKRTLEFAKRCKPKNMLFISSGAVYGKINAETPFLSEEKLCQLDPIQLGSAYALGKVLAEYLCGLYAKEYSIPIKIARCFASVGPYLPLDVHFAIGNFINNRLRNEGIVIKSDGTPYRSYLYAADLCIWLWTILLRGKNLTPYNVGSDQRYSLHEVAELVANTMLPKLKLKIMKTPIATHIPESYVPDISRARKDLNLSPKIGLAESINKTINFYLTKNSANPLQYHLWNNL
jgi:nucleoside-diphosphate-sugar epimerase